MGPTDRADRLAVFLLAAAVVSAFAAALLVGGPIDRPDSDELPVIVTNLPVQVSASVGDASVEVVVPAPEDVEPPE